MVTFEDSYLEAVIVAQKYKLSPDVPVEVFKDAVKNAYQLLSLTMSHSGRGAREEANVEFAKLESAMKRKKTQISDDVKNVPPEFQDWKKNRVVANEEFDEYNRFLGVLISLGHKYNLFPRSGRVDHTPAPSYDNLMK